MAPALAGCGGGGGPATTTAPGTTAEGPRRTPIEATTVVLPDPGPEPFQAGGVARAVAALRRQIGAEPRLILVSVSRDSIVFIVQNHRVRRFVDRYVWRDGRMEGPNAPGERDPREIAPLVFFARQVDLRAVPRLVQRGDRMPFEGSRTISVDIERSWFDAYRVRFRVNVNGTRRGAQLRADARGRVTEVLP